MTPRSSGAASPLPSRALGVGRVAGRRVGEADRSVSEARENPTGQRPGTPEWVSPKSTRENARESPPEYPPGQARKLD